MITPEGISVLVVLLIHFGLFAWCLRSILKSEASSFEKSSWVLVALILPLIGPGVYYTYKENYFTKDEFFHLAIAILILGFVFSFRMWGSGEFSVPTGINNWLRMCGLALVALGIHLGAQKILAKRYDAVTHFKIWSLGAVLAIVLAFITNGLFKWAALGLFIVTCEPFFRPGRASEKPHISPFEISKIIACGPFASIVLALLTKLFSNYLNKELAQQFFSMNLWIAIFSVIPFMLLHFWPSAYVDKFMHRKKYGEARWGSGVPKAFYMSIKQSMRTAGTHISEGEWIFFGSRPLWVFISVLVFSTAALLMFLGPIASFILSLILAIILYAIWGYKMEPQK